MIEKDSIPHGTSFDINFPINFVSNSYFINANSIKSQTSTTATFLYTKINNKNINKVNIQFGTSSGGTERNLQALWIAKGY